MLINAAKRGETIDCSMGPCQPGVSMNSQEVVKFPAGLLANFRNVKRAL